MSFYRYEDTFPEDWAQAPAVDVNFSSVVYVDSGDREGSQPGCSWWQTQYYSETLEASSSLSLLAQTKQEEDEIFYATFPQARPVHWTPQTSPDSEYFGDTAFYLSPDSGYKTQYCASSTPYGSECVNVENVPTFSLSDTQTSSTVGSELMVAYNLYSGESTAQDDNNLSPYTDTFLISEPHNLAKVEPICLSLPPSPQSDVSTSVNGGGMYNSNHEPPMDFLPPPCPEAKYPLPQSIIAPSPIGSPSRMSLQPDEPISLGQPSSSTMIPLATPSSRSNADLSIQSEPPGLMRLSPLPINRRPVEKKKAQTLACNFCRMRKIACGPPMAGTTEKICNQCQRRSRECVFPTESRRGMRRKKGSRDVGL